MNSKLIEELKQKAMIVEKSHGAFGEPERWEKLDVDMFAELIIKECLTQLNDAKLGAPEAICAGLNFGKVVIQEHFGVK